MGSRRTDRTGHCVKKTITRTVWGYLVALVVTGCLTADGPGGEDGFACQPHFAGPIPCEPECDASNTVIIERNPYCSVTCGDFGECHSGHICATFSETSIPPDICLPPCNDGSDCPSGFAGICSVEGVCGL